MFQNIRSEADDTTGSIIRLWLDPKGSRFLGWYGKTEKAELLAYKLYATIFEVKHLFYSRISSPLFNNEKGGCAIQMYLHFLKSE